MDEDVPSRVRTLGARAQGAGSVPWRQSEEGVSEVYAQEKPSLGENIMAHASYVQSGNAGVDVASTATALAGNPALQAFWALRVGFTIAPIVAGVDKFLHWLVDWDQYVSPGISALVGGHAHAFMLVVGVVEIVAGIGVALRPRIFSYVVAAWLLGIIANLLMIPGYYDIALRDLGLAIGALALGRLSESYDRGRAVGRAVAS